MPLNELYHFIEKIKKTPKLIFVDDYEIVVEKFSSLSTHKSIPAHHPTSSPMTQRHSEIWLQLRILYRKQPGIAQVILSGERSISDLLEMAFESAALSCVNPWFKFPLWNKLSERAPFQQDTHHYTYKPHPIEELIESKADTHIHNQKDNSFDKSALNHKRLTQYSHWESLICRKSEKEIRPRIGNRCLTTIEMTCQTSTTPLFISDKKQTKDILTEHDYLDWVSQLACFQGQPMDSLLETPPTPTPSYPMPVLLMPKVAVSCLRSLIPWFCADNQALGTQLLHQEKHISSAISLIDDGTVDAPTGGHWVDLEGCATQKINLIENGKILNFLYDTYTSAYHNRKSTASLTRLPGHLKPHISPNCLSFSSTHTEQLEGMTKSIPLFFQWMAMESIDIELSGDCFMKGRGYLVNDGVLSPYLYTVYLSTSLWTLFERVLCMGEDTLYVGAVGAPSILIDKVPVYIM